MKARSYAIIGAGAVGGLYGARLQQAGLDVKFLLHSDYEHVRQQGLRIDSPEGNIRLRKVAAFNDARKMPPCDVVVVSLKATANPMLASILPQVARPDSTVVLFQNGLGGEEKIERLVRPATVLGAQCFLCANKIGPGHIQHLDYGSITLGLFTRNGQKGGIVPVMRAIASDFETSGTRVKLAEDLILARWKKLVWNIPFNGLSVVLNADTKEIMCNKQTRELAIELMRETVGGAGAVGRKIPAAFVNQTVRNTDRMTPYKTSMMLDHERKQPMEVEAIYGEPLRVAARHGVRMPQVKMLYDLLKFKDHRCTCRQI